MLQSVNRKEFTSFGAVFEERSQITALPNCHSVSLSPRETSVYETAAETWLSAESGFPILSIATGETDFLDFYLDRTVRLKPGVRFSLTALGSWASVQVAGFLMPRLMHTKGSSRFEIAPTLKINRLCALLYQDAEPGYPFPGRTHTMSELLYVDSGSLHCTANGQDILLEQGDMLLYAGNQWHTQQADREKGAKFVTVSFEAEGIALESLSAHPFRSPKKAVALLQEMLREQERMDPFSGDLLLSLLQALLLTLLRDRQQDIQAQETTQCLNSENQIIRLVQQYIADHITEKLTVPIAAQSAQVSASYLTALFHTHLQISPGEYIRRMKLQKSKQLIREGNLNFTEIAQMLEYSSVYNFSRQFKQAFGITPSEYAKSVK